MGSALPLHLVPADVAAHVRSHAVQFLRPADPFDGYFAQLLHDTTFLTAAKEISKYYLANAANLAKQHPPGGSVVKRLAAFLAERSDQELRDLRDRIKANETSHIMLVPSSVIRANENRFGFSDWVRKDRLARQDGTSKNITIGTDVVLIADQHTKRHQLKKGLRGTVEGSGSSGLTSAKDAVGTAAAMWVRFPPTDIPPPPPEPHVPLPTREERRAAQHATFYKLEGHEQKPHDAGDWGGLEAMLSRWQAIPSNAAIAAGAMMPSSVEMDANREYMLESARKVVRGYGLPGELVQAPPAGIRLSFDWSRVDPQHPMRKRWDGTGGIWAHLPSPRAMSFPHRELEDPTNPAEVKRYFESFGLLRAPSPYTDEKEFRAEARKFWAIVEAAAAYYKIPVEALSDNAGPYDPPKIKVETWRLQKEQTPVNKQSVHPGVESSQKAPARPIKKGDIVRFNKQSVHSHSRRGWRGTVQRVDGDMLYVDWRAADGDLRYRNEPTSEDDIARVT